MTLKRKSSVAVILPPAFQPARWRWFHTVGLIVTVIVLGLTWLFPANAAAAAGQIVVSEENAFYMRAILGGLALWVGYGARSQPAWAVIVCTLIAFFAAGQIVRAEYTAEVTGIPAALLWVNLAGFVLLVALAWRPTSQERLEQMTAERDAALAELRRLRGE